MIRIEYDEYVAFLYPDNDGLCRVVVELKTCIRIPKEIPILTVSQEEIEDAIREPIKQALTTVFKEVE